MPSLTDAYNWAIDICNDDINVYNQNHRNGEKDANGYTCWDCSSFINFALVAGGWETPRYAPNHNAFTTPDQIAVLTSLGFVEVSPSGDILPGDIGWNTEHTEMAYSSGTNGRAIFMGAHGRNGVELKNQVSIGDKQGNATATRAFTKIFRYEGAPVENGRSLYVISAIAGNMDAESTLSPGTWESLTVRNWDSQYSNNTGGYGLGQWTNVGTSTGRLWKLYTYLVSSGFATNSGEGQCQYILDEDYWTPNSAFEFQTLSEFLASDSTDIDYLTGAWNRCWEGIPVDTSRYALSRYYYDYISANMDNTNITGWIARNAFLSQAERDNNSVMLYRNLKGRPPGDNDDPGYNAGDDQNNPGIASWFDLFLMALGGKDHVQKLKIRRRKQ